MKVLAKTIATALIWVGLPFLNVLFQEANIIAVGSSSHPIDLSTGTMLLIFGAVLITGAIWSET